MTRTSSPRAPHAPELGLLARLLGPLQVTGVFWYRFHGFGVRACPGWLVAPLMALFSVFFFITLGKIRRALAANSMAAQGACSWPRAQLRAFRTIHQFAWCLTERYEALCTRAKMNFRMVGEDHWHRVLESGDGFILATAHVGNWEIGAAQSPEQAGRRTHLVREEESDPRAQEFISRLISERFGDQFVTHFATTDVSLGLRLRAFLTEGDIVALQADRPRAGGTTVTTSLFGRPFKIPRGVLALARTSGVLILPAFTMRTGRRSYEVCFSTPIRVTESGSRLASDGRAGRDLAMAMEEVIQRHPHQWFCFHRLWPKPSR